MDALSESDPSPRSPAIQAQALSELDRKGTAVPEDVSPMADAPEAPPQVTAEVVTPPPTPAAPARRASSGKRSAAESWADWRATGSAASAKTFCESVTSWIEGASSQLIRPLWPAGGVRPTASDVQVRLRKGLALVVSEEADYVKGPEAARRHVARELSAQRARDVAAR
jgi:hypothetical protein